MSPSVFSASSVGLIILFVCVVFCDKCSGSLDHVDAASVSGEYCHFETFRPRCRWRNEVIVMKTARYGRMRLGRCVSESTKLGCSADVLQIVGGKCSGKRECEIRLPDSDLDALKPCGEMWTYLEASYACMKVVEGSRSCAVTVTSSEPVHIRAQTSGTTCGSSGQPWQLDSPAGQRITVSVVDFAPHRPGDGGPAHRRVYGFLVDRTQKTNVSICETSEERATPEVHGGRETTDAQAGFSRDKRLALITSSNSAELLIVRDENLANNFLIRVEATGCANIIPPEDAYLKRVDDGSVVVGCYETRQTWLLTCQGSQWTGTVGACDPRTNPHDHDDTLPGESRDSSHYSNEIFQIVAIIAVASVGLAVCLTIICIGIYCLRRYPKKKGTEDSNGPCHSMLINNSGHWSAKAGPPQSLSATTTSYPTPSGQYFILDPEHTNA